MSCFFMIDVYIDGERGRGMYDSYIRKVRPIVERFGGRYLVRTENVFSLSPSRNPQRVILIEFPDREALNACFSSDEYKAIAGERAVSMPAPLLRKDKIKSRPEPVKASLLLFLILVKIHSVFSVSYEIHERRSVKLVIRAETVERHTERLSVGYRLHSVCFPA